MSGNVVGGILAVLIAASLLLRKKDSDVGFAQGKRPVVPKPPSTTAAPTPPAAPVMPGKPAVAPIAPRAPRWGPPSPEPAPKIELDVMVRLSYIDPTANKIQLIKLVRDFTNLGLREAKDLVDTGPGACVGNLPQAKAEQFRQALKHNGADCVFDETPIRAALPGTPRIPIEGQIGPAFAVELTSATNKIQAIKIIREATQLGLREAKDLVDEMPSIVVTDVTREEAERIVGLFRQIEASANVREF